MKIGVFYPGPWLAAGSERHLLALASVLSDEGPVEILTFRDAPPQLCDALHLDLSRVRFRTLPETACDRLAAHTAVYDLWVNASAWHPVPSRSPMSLYLVLYPPPLKSTTFYRLRRALGTRLRPAVEAGAFRGLASRLAPRAVRRLRLLSTVPPREALASYRMILANSEFTRALVRRRWRREGRVLYPPADVEAFRPLPKRRMILSVGRFGRGGNNKKYDVLIEAFRRLVDGGFRGWELHLAGGAYTDPWNRVYFEQITRAASGYPIVLHPNVRFDALRQLYGASEIYWHGAGYGENEDRNPQRVEHFGITTVESMAAGCIPLVCGKGGQPEIVSHGVNGFLWSNLEELQRYTRRVADMPELAERLRVQAIDRSRYFGMERFAARVEEILDDLEHPRPAFRGHH